jgi:hypothetical protein
LARSDLDPINLTWRYRTIIQSPFIPFIILFCHVIETSETSDLEHMRGIVETLESTSNTPVHNTCAKQRRLFKALYDVAEKYVKVKSRDDSGQVRMPWSMQYVHAFTRKASNELALSPLDSAGIVGDSGTTNTVDAPGPLPLYSEANGESMGLVGGLDGPMVFRNTAFGDVDVEMDLSGAQLWDWFNKNQSMMRMLEDT